jgi:hypothetical protein
MKRRCLLSGAVALFVATSAQALPPSGKSGAQLLEALATGTAGDPGGAVTTTTGLGLFEAAGVGSKGDAELTRAIAEVDALAAILVDLRNDFAPVLASLPSGSDATALQAAHANLSAAQTVILNCAAAVEAAALAPGTDATDGALLEYAEQLVGEPTDTSSDCASVLAAFATINQAIVGDASNHVEGAYLPLARALRPSFPFERLASHFIQYSLTQRAALTLLRGAYSLLGRPDALESALTTEPYALLNALHDEEIAFFHAADAYVVTDEPSAFSVVPGALADAVVQRLEGTRAQLSTYSLSTIDAPAFTPTVHDASQAAVAVTDHLASDAASYYDTADVQLRAGIPGCASGNDGYAYVRPYPGQGAGFKIASTCTVHVARHLKWDLTADAEHAWSARGRYATSEQALAFAPRNAATLADETSAEAFALAANAAGEASGSSELLVVADASDPSVVSLAVDLPNQPNTPLRAGAAHAFVAAGTGDVARFTRVPFGPDAPDRYALALNDTYLAVGSDGFATLDASPVWFDFRPAPGGHTELAYDGGVLFVDVQSLQAFFGEAPDTSLVNAANVATGLGVVGWTVPTDLPRPPPSGQLSLYPNCLQPSGTSAPATPLAPYNVGTTECSDFGLPYQEYVAVFKNEDSVPRSFRFTLGATATWVSVPVSVESGGVHCFAPGIGSPDDHFDIGGVDVTAAVPSASVPAFTFTPAGWYLTVPASGSFELDCQVLDWGGNPSGLLLDNFTVEPCRESSAPGTCVVYP